MYYHVLPCLMHCTIYTMQYNALCPSFCPLGTRRSSRPSTYYKTQCVIHIQYRMSFISSTGVQIGQNRLFPSTEHMSYRVLPCWDLSYRIHLSTTFLLTLLKKNFSFFKYGRILPLAGCLGFRPIYRLSAVQEQH